MSEPSRATFLGTGTSVGVPVIGCPCPVCTSDHPGNKRTRSSLHLTTPRVSVLVDTGPDLREQALRENLTALDAVLYTHPHLDHVAGFDELRAFCWHRESPLPLYAGPETMAVLEQMYPWAMTNTEAQNYVRPAPEVIDGPFTLDDLEVVPVPVQHATVETFGFRFNLPSGHSFAYLSDVKEIPDTSLTLLENLEVLAIDALRPTPHATHMSIAEALAVSDALQPKQTLLTHVTHDVDYPTASKELPDNVAFACDGLKLRFVEDSPCAMFGFPSQ